MPIMSFNLYGMKNQRKLKPLKASAMPQSDF